MAAVGVLRDDLGPPPNTGDTRADLVEMLAQAQGALERGPGFAMIGALLVEESRNPDLFELFRERIIRRRRDEAVAVLQRGVERGEVRPDADLEVAVHAMVGATFMRHMLGIPESRQRIERTVDTIWRGLASNSQGE